MGLVIATLFIIYGPILFAYRASTLGIATKEDAIASIFVTCIGLWLMLSICLTYERIIFKPVGAIELPKIAPPTILPPIDLGTSETAEETILECLEER